MWKRFTWYPAKPVDLLPLFMLQLCYFAFCFIILSRLPLYIKSPFWKLFLISQVMIWCCIKRTSNLIKILISACMAEDLSVCRQFCAKLDCHQRLGTSAPTEPSLRWPMTLSKILNYCKTFNTAHTISRILKLLS